jgi:hypothetical protein
MTGAIQVEFSLFGSAFTLFNVLIEGRSIVTLRGSGPVVSRHWAERFTRMVELALQARFELKGVTDITADLASSPVSGCPEVN